MPKLIVPEARHACEATRGAQDGVSELQRIECAAPVSQHDGEQLVVAQGRGPHSRQLLTRPIVRREVLHAPLPLLVPSVVASLPPSPGCRAPAGTRLVDAAEADEAPLLVYSCAMRICF